jgi:hypothetical protein
MPLVDPNPTLRDALESFIAQARTTKAEAATRLGVDPMTLARFLKTGRVIDANRRKLEDGLARVGAWQMTAVLKDSYDRAPPTSIISSDKVIAALEFLLTAAREARAVDARHD